jgi:4-alpha-glucanotransferase
VALQIGYVGAPCIYYGDEILMDGYKDPFNRRTYPWGKVSREGAEHLEYVRKLTELRTKNRVLRTGFYRTLYTDEDVIVFERFLDNENRDAFGSSVMPSQGARKVVVFINRGHKGAYFKLDDSGRDFKLEPVEAPAVSLSSDTVIKGISFGPMQAGVPSLSALFVVYDQ